jgi:hypothetical protein
VREPTNLVLDAVLDGFDTDLIRWHDENAAATTWIPRRRPARARAIGKPVPIEPIRLHNQPQSPTDFTARLAMILIAAGSYGYGRGFQGGKNRQAKRLVR